MQKYINTDRFITIKNFIKKGFSKQQAECLYDFAARKSKYNVNKKDVTKIRYEIINLKQEMIRLELRMIIKLGGLLAMGISLMAMMIEFYMR